MAYTEEKETQTFLADPFISLLRDNPKALARISREMQEVVHGVTRFNKKGTLAVKLEMNSETDPEDQDADNEVSVRISSTPTVPRAKSGKARTYYATKENNLSRSHPNQIAIPLNI